MKKEKHTDAQTVSWRELKKTLNQNRFLRFTVKFFFVVAGSMVLLGMLADCHRGI